MWGVRANTQYGLVVFPSFHLQFGNRQAGRFSHPAVFPWVQDSILDFK